MAVVAAISVADPPGVWSALGFDVEDGSCRVGTVNVRLGAPGSGVTGWSLGGCETPPGWTGSLDGLPTSLGAPGDPGCPPGRHPNGALSIDHVVVSTPDLDRTVAGLAGLGAVERRRRAAGRGMTQVFFRLGEVILELVGPEAPSAGSDPGGPASFWGLAFTVTDLPATAGLLGDRLGPARPAVQPGRSIATVSRDAGSTVPIVFMSA